MNKQIIVRQQNVGFNFSFQQGALVLNCLLTYLCGGWGARQIPEPRCMSRQRPTVAKLFKSIHILKMTQINFVLKTANSCQHSNFGLSWPGRLAKGKRQNITSHWNFLCSAQRLHCNSLVSLLSIQSKTWSSFLSSLAELAQKFKFL